MNLYTPPTEHFEGYTQYPRPVSKYLNNLKQKERFHTTSDGRSRQVRKNNFFNPDLPNHLAKRATSTAGQSTKRSRLSSARSVRSVQREHPDAKFAKVKFESKLHRKILKINHFMNILV